jgi:hypothetical protein
MSGLWLLLLLPGLALAFSSGPSRSCRIDPDCVLVQETSCGTIHAVALGQDKAWADWEAKDRARGDRVCPEGPRPSHRNYDALCRSGQCEAVPRSASEDEGEGEGGR